MIKPVSYSINSYLPQQRSNNISFQALPPLYPDRFVSAVKIDLADNQMQRILGYFFAGQKEKINSAMLDDRDYSKTLDAYEKVELALEKLKALKGVNLTQAMTLKLLNNLMEQREKEKERAFMATATPIGRHALEDEYLKLLGKDIIREWEGKLNPKMSNDEKNAASEKFKNEDFPVAMAIKAKHIKKLDRPELIKEYVDYKLPEDVTNERLVDVLIVAHKQTLEEIQTDADNSYAWVMRRFLPRGFENIHPRRTIFDIGYQSINVLRDPEPDERAVPIAIKILKTAYESTNGEAYGELQQAIESEWSDIPAKYQAQIKSQAVQNTPKPKTKKGWFF